MAKPSMPSTPVSGAGAWRGRELAERTDWIRTFTAAELAELDEAIRAFRSRGVALADISPASFPLPGLSATMAGILAELLGGRGFVLMRGFPVERYSREEQAIAYLGL